MSRPAGTIRQQISLRTRVTLLVAVCVGAAVALVSFGAYLTVSNSLYDEVDNSLVRRAESAVNAPLVPSPRVGDVPGALLSAADVRIGLLDANGQLTIPRDGVKPPVGAEELGVATGDRPNSLRTDERTGSRVIAVRYEEGRAIVIAQSLQPTEDTLGKLAIVLLLIGGAGVVVAALAGTAVARTGLRPVERLTRATERVARTGDLRPIKVSGDDELARLTHSFNIMLGTVAQAQERQRRLVADAGHELRTPLTSLRTNLELLLAAEAPDAPSLSEKDKEEIRDDLRGQLDELTQLIGDLVELAREDAPELPQERVDMVELVEQALDRARRRATGVQFEVGLQPWHVIGDAGSLERAVLNLLDNAVKFSPPGGTVRVELQPAGDGYAFLQIADAGPGINDADLPHVFERFYRSREARTLPGSGLGLAIVKQAAERHGGSVYASRSADGGALMAMRLPGSQI